MDDDIEEIETVELGYELDNPTDLPDIPKIKPILEWGTVFYSLILLLILAYCINLFSYVFVCHTMDYIPIFKCEIKEDMDVIERELEIQNMNYKSANNLLNMENQILTIKHNENTEIRHYLEDRLNDMTSSFWECEGYDPTYIKQHPNLQAKTDIENALIELNEALLLYNQTGKIK